MSADLAALGYQVIRRSDYISEDLIELEVVPHAALLIDTTGELAQWTALADLSLIGKSWLPSGAKGGQNPFESIIQGVPTICGPHMSNFEPLLSAVVAEGGAIQLDSLEQLGSTIQQLYLSPETIPALSQRGQAHLVAKVGATQKTAQIIHSVGGSV